MSSVQRASAHRYDGSSRKRPDAGTAQAPSERQPTFATLPIQRHVTVAEPPGERGDDAGAVVEVAVADRLTG